MTGGNYLKSNFFGNNTMWNSYKYKGHFLLEQFKLEMVIINCLCFAEKKGYSVNLVLIKEMDQLGDLS